MHKLRLFGRWLVHSLVLLLGLAAVAAPAAAQTRTAEIVFVVDESGSMAGEQTFLQTFVPAIETQLLAAGLNSVQFGLVGYGNSAVAPRQFLIAGQPFGNASDWATAANALEVSGGTEDGYAGIQYVLDNYNFASGANTAVIVLVTDEDRDNTNNALTFQVILVNLQNANVSLSAILDQAISNANNDIALATNGVITFVDTNNDGVPEEAGAPVFGGADGTTFDDYTNLVLSFENGCVADLNQLRAGGTAAQAFAATLARCLVQQALGGNGDDIFLAPSTALGRAALLGHADALSFRLSGRFNGLDGPYTMVENAARTRRSFAIASYGEGQRDAVFGQPGFDYDSMQLLMGFDADLNERALAGFSIGYSDGESGSDARADSWEHKFVTFGLHGAMELGNGVSLDGQALYGVARYKTRRAVATIAGPDVATASPDGDLFALRVRASRTYEMFGAEVTPHVGATYTRAEVDGYTESSAAGLSVAAFEQEITTADIGFEAQGRMQTRFGEVRPSLQLGAEYAIDSDNENVVITTPSGGGFQQLLPAYHELTGVVGLGASLRSEDGRSAVRFGYEGRFSEDGESHAIALRGRVRF